MAVRRTSRPSARRKERPSMTLATSPASRIGPVHADDAGRVSAAGASAACGRPWANAPGDASMTAPAMRPTLLLHNVMANHGHGAPATPMRLVLSMEEEAHPIAAEIIAAACDPTGFGWKHRYRCSDCDGPPPGDNHAWDIVKTWPHPGSVDSLLTRAPVAEQRNVRRLSGDFLCPSRSRAATCRRRLRPPVGLTAV